jgi:hypothetical protein
LWKQSANAKLQQQPLAKKISTKHAALLRQSMHHIMALERLITAASPFCADLVQQGYPGYGHELVDAVLEAKPVSTIARLLVWLQRQPDMLQLHALEDDADSDVAAARDSSSSSSGSYGRLWLTCILGERAGTRNAS